MVTGTIRCVAPISFALLATAAGAVAGETRSKEPDSAPPAQTTARKPQETVALPHIRVNLKTRTVDLDAKICLREGLLELLVTTEGGKEHEACFAIRAKPRNVQVALMMLGLRPGAPGHAVPHGDGYRFVHPTGDPVRVSVRFVKDGKTVERPVTDFAYDARRKRRMAPVDFIFAGSRVVKVEDRTYFAADGDGSVVSLVSFGTEILAHPVAASPANETIVWVARDDDLPENLKSVVIRLRPGGAPKPGKKAERAKPRGDAN